MLWTVCRAIWSAPYFGEGHRVWVSSDQLVFVDRFEMFQVGVIRPCSVVPHRLDLDRDRPAPDEILAVALSKSYVYDSSVPLRSKTETVLI